VDAANHHRSALENCFVKGHVSTPCCCWSVRVSPKHSMHPFSVTHCARRPFSRYPRANNRTTLFVLWRVQAELCGCAGTPAAGVEQVQRQQQQQGQPRRPRLPFQVQPSRCRPCRGPAMAAGCTICSAVWTGNLHWCVWYARGSTSCSVSTKSF
jgi:hypothetical protein